MNLEAYRAWIRHTPLPTDDQCRRFAWHVMRVHSWYKGSLLRGTRIVVYIDPELGGGFTGGRRVRDRKWHFTRHEYRDEYGRLAYLWGGRHGPPSSDYILETVDETRAPGAAKWAAHVPPELPPEIVEQCSFEIYPFICSKEFFLHGDILRHRDAIRAVWAGRAHPHRRLLCQLDEADFSGGDFDYEKDVRPVWSLLAARPWRPAHLPPEIAVPAQMRPLSRLVDDLRWAADQSELTPRQRECARHLWRHHRKAACLERTERLKITLALRRLRALARD